MFDPLKRQIFFAEFFDAGVFLGGEATVCMGGGGALCALSRRCTRSSGAAGLTLQCCMSNGGRDSDCYGFIDCG